MSRVGACGVGCAQQCVQVFAGVECATVCRGVDVLDVHLDKRQHSVAQVCVCVFCMCTGVCVCGCSCMHGCELVE